MEFDAPLCVLLTSFVTDGELWICPTTEGPQICRKSSRPRLSFLSEKPAPIPSDHLEDAAAITRTDLSCKCDTIPLRLCGLADQAVHGRCTLQETRLPFMMVRIVSTFPVP